MRPPKPSQILKQQEDGKYVQQVALAPLRAVPYSRTAVPPRHSGSKLIHLDEKGGDLGTVVVEGGGVGHAEVRLLHVQLSRRHLGVLLCSFKAARKRELVYKKNVYQV